MHHFTMRAHDIESANTKQAETYESHRQYREFDSDYSDCDDNIALIDCYNMDREQVDCNCNESNDDWVEYVSNQTKEPRKICSIWFL